MSDVLNVARIKKANELFEVVVNPEQAMAFRQGKGSIDDALVFPKVFSDAKKGLQASEQRMQALFNTSDPVEVAKQIIQNGEIQLTAEYRKKLSEDKRKRIIDLIHRNGVDPRTNAPHPATRIDAALAEAKVKIDEFQPPEAQIQRILKQLTPILPIKFVTKQIDVRIPAEFAAKGYAQLKGFGKVIKEDWESDGSWHAVIELPGGLEGEFYDKINKLTRGSAEAQVVGTK